MKEDSNKQPGEIPDGETNSFMKSADSFHFPRILIVYPTGIYRVDQSGLMIRALFNDWPKSHLAQLYSGGEDTSPMYCGQTFKLANSERRLGQLFFSIKHSSLGESTYHFQLTQQPSKHTPRRMSGWAHLKSAFSKFLLNTGLWEIIFSPVLSDRMLAWIESFKPEVIYAQGYSLSFAWLPVMLSQRFNIPIVFQTTDDWPNALYKHVPGIHQLVLRAARELIHHASARLAFSQRMADAYYKQFGVPFDILMNCDDLSRFDDAKNIRITDSGVISIVYTGGLALKRWETLCDLSDAAAALEKEGIRIQITAFVSSIPVEGVNVVNARQNLKILPPLAHEQVPEYLKGADILFLPESFDPSLIEDLRYSISTKAHLYMMSRQPILVYGPTEAGTIDYAQREHWAHVVSERSQNALITALHMLISDQALRVRLVKTGVEVALRNHDQRIVRSNFLTIMQKAVEQINKP